MKKVCLLLLIAGFAGCSSDDDATQSTEVSIYGKWYYKDTVVNDNTYPYDDHEECGKDYIEFYDTDKVRSVDVWDCEEDIDGEGNFTITADNIMTIVAEGITTTVEIIELSSTKLSYTYTTDRNEDGVEDTIIENFDR